MNPLLIKIVSGTLSTLGFAIIFRLKPSHLIFASLDGLIACLCLVAFSEFEGVFIPNVAAAFAAAIFAEIFARIAKTPSTVFILPGCIALVPGGSLYYAMSSLLSQNNNEAFAYFLEALTVGVGIGGGVIVASVLLLFITQIKKKFSHKSGKPKKFKSHTHKV